MATALHVVEGTIELSVTDHTGRSTAYMVDRRLPHRDAALLVPSRAPQARTEAAAQAESYRQGEPVVIIGYPYNAIGIDLLVGVEGVLAGSARWGVGATAPLYHVLDARTTVGNSGSPVFNLAGQLIGMVTHIGGPFSFDLQTGEVIYGLSDYIDTFTYAVDLTGGQLQ